MIWVHIVGHRGFLNISADEKSRRLLLPLALRVNHTHLDPKIASASGAPLGCWYLVRLSLLLFTIAGRLREAIISVRRRNGSVLD